jgi:peptide/nickel transport system substrate-binding protein
MRAGRDVTLAFILAVSTAVLSPAVSLAEPKTLRIGLQEDPDILDPHRARTFVGRIVFKALCDKLFDTRPDFSLVGRLATNWGFSDDGLTLTITLRPGVTFHDGSRFDAAAAKANLDRARTLPDSLRQSELASVGSVEVVDSLTIALRLIQKDAALLSQLADRAGMMVSPASFGSDMTRPVCSGPYRFVERVQNDRIVAERFHGHWNAANYHFDRIIYRTITDGRLRVANLRSGDLDFLERLPPLEVKSVSADPSLRVVKTPGIGFQALLINLNHGALSNTPVGRDKRVRQAFAAALDRNVINQVVFQNTHPPAVQALPPSSPYAQRGLEIPPRDITRARALMREAGVVTPLALELLITNSSTDALLGQVIQSMVADAGFVVSLRAVEFGTQLREQQQGRFQLSRLGWSGRIDPDGNTHPFWHSTGNQNDGKYSNREIDRILQTARSVYDPVERTALYHTAQSIVLDEVPIIYLYNQPWYYAMSPRLTGFQLHPDGMIRLEDLKWN